MMRLFIGLCSAVRKSTGAEAGKGPCSTKLQGKLGILLFFNNIIPLPQGKAAGTAW
ncbi:suspensor-specific protein [Roseibium sp. TrichSKD4]|nr:suspensor-specific protein [Roseibium sp. TrichSKD4]